MDALQKQAIINILLSTNTKSKPRIKCPKSGRKIYENMKIHLNGLKESSELFAELLEGDELDIDEVISGLSDVNLSVTFDDAIVALNREMRNVVESITIEEEEASVIVGKVVADLNDVLKQYGFIENKWTPYGSYKTGLCCIDSDIDLFFENVERDDRIKNIKTSMARCLKKSTRFSKVNYIKTARIPIIKLKHIYTGKECDISFCESGVKSSMLNKLYIRLNPSVKIFTLYLKVLLKKYDLYGTNRMTSHVIFWLVVFFFQQKKLLPPVKDIRKKYADCQKTDLFKNWNFSVKENFSYSFSASVRLPLLLLEFAKFYKDFNFAKKVISPYLGSTIPIEKYAEWKIPETVFPLHLLKYNSDGENTFYRHVINLQEPSILSSNLAKNMTTKHVNLFKIFCNELLSSFKRYTLSDDFLTKILPEKLPRIDTLPRNLIQYASINLKFEAMDDSNLGKSKTVLCRAIHRLMEAILLFELKSTSSEEVYRQVKHDKKKKSKICRKIEISEFVVVVYMNYSSTVNTWKKNDVRKLLLFPNIPGKVNEGIDRSINVYFVGVIDPTDRKARIMIQTDLYLCRFFHKYGSVMLQQLIST